MNDCKKCCLNCEHYCPWLGDEITFHHIHDYCTVWDRSNPCLCKHPLTNFLEDYYMDVEEANGEFHIYDDIECGLAGCYLFRRKEDIDISDKDLTERLLENIYSAKKTISYVLEKGKLHDIVTHRKRKLSIYDTEDFQVMTDLLENMLKEINEQFGEEIKHE